MHIIYNLARQTVPVITLLMLIVCSVLPIGLLDSPDIFPMLTLSSVFYWAIYRPDLTPPILIFLAGLLQDILLGTLLGSMAVIFLGVYGVTLSQRKIFIGKTFYLTWFGFTVISGIGFFSIWLFSGLSSGTLMLSLAPLVQYILTVLSFPLLVWVFVRIQRYLVD